MAKEAFAYMCPCTYITSVGIVACWKCARVRDKECINLYPDDFINRKIKPEVKERCYQMIKDR